jgi:chaperone required for assembly of F1-ATPase
MSAETDERPPRFYETVAVEKRAGGFVVLLDDKLLKTPQARIVFAATEALADLVAAEWSAQAERIDWFSMPVTRLVLAAVDRGEKERRQLGADVVRHLETDVVCHVSDDPELARREEATWAPLRAWAAETLGIALNPVSGVVATAQPVTSIEAAHDRLAALDGVCLVALGLAAMLLGSAVLALALLEGRLDAAQAFAASRLEETHQAERWGRDAEAAARSERLAAELVVLERVMRAAAKPLH